MASLPVGEAWKKGEAEDLSVIPNCLCPACGGGNATTTMLPTKIPSFREIYIMHLQCNDCNFRNSEVNFGGEIRERGCRIELRVESSSDLNRQLIKSDSATLSIPSVELEIPPHTQRGTVTTLEGFLITAANNLERDQPERLRLGDVDNFHRCRGVVARLNRMAGRSSDDDDEDEDEDVFPFTVVLDDPAGNSFVENPSAPAPDPRLTTVEYDRVPSQDMALGLQPSAAARTDNVIDDADPRHRNLGNAAPSVAVDLPPKDDDNVVPGGIGRREVLKFPTPCPSCSAPAETDACVTDVPHFKEIVIMSLVCENCGYRSNEIKGGGGVPEFGTTVTLRVKRSEDLEREVLKSDTAGLSIPELDLELNEGGLDGQYTTVEGLLKKLKHRLETANPFAVGDAAVKHHKDNDAENGAFSEPDDVARRYKDFLGRLDAMADGRSLPFTLIVTDPLSNSFVGPVPRDALALSLRAEKEGHQNCYDEYVDPGMTITEFERSADQNDDLGLTHMRTENYQNDDNETTNHGTDAPLPLPDRLARPHARGPDHPVRVAMAPVDGDVTVMGAGSAVHATPAAARRGARTTTTRHDDETRRFEPSKAWTGRREGMLFRTGTRGTGYYEDDLVDRSSSSSSSSS